MARQRTDPGTLGSTRSKKVDPNATTCTQCGRAVLKTHVNAQGECIICVPDNSPEPHTPTENEMADLGRPDGMEDK